MTPQATGGEDSIDLGPLLRGGDAPSTREAIVHHSLDGMFAIRKGDWKLIEGLGSGGFTNPRRRTAGEEEPPHQLYNLADDPAEATNLAGQHPEKAAELAALLDLYRREGRSVPAP